MFYVRMKNKTYEKNRITSIPRQRKAVSVCSWKSNKFAAAHVTEMGENHVLNVITLKVRAHNLFLEFSISTQEG